MKILLKIYLASCLIVVGFFTFFLIPWGLLPFSDAVNLMVVGGVVFAIPAAMAAYTIKREGFDLGWLLANRGGFWIVTAAVLGLVVFGCGTLLFVSPELFVPAFEQGALPFGIALVSLFWLALIFMFGYFAFRVLSEAAAYTRVLRFGSAFGGLALGLFCLGLAAVFVSLYLEVLNDILIRISEGSRSAATWTFAFVLFAISLAVGVIRKPEELLDDIESNG